MSTKIQCKVVNSAKVDFENLPEDTAFVYDDVPYYKTRFIPHFNAIDLRTMRPKLFEPNYKITPHYSMEISLK